MFSRRAKYNYDCTGKEVGRTEYRHEYRATLKMACNHCINAHPSSRGAVMASGSYLRQPHLQHEIKCEPLWATNEEALRREERARLARERSMAAAAAVRRASRATSSASAGIYPREEQGTSGGHRQLRLNRANPSVATARGPTIADRPKVSSVRFSRPLTDSGNGGIGDSISRDSGGGSLLRAQQQWVERQANDAEDESDEEVNSAVDSSALTSSNERRSNFERRETRRAARSRRRELRDDASHRGGRSVDDEALKEFEVKVRTMH